MMSAGNTSRKCGECSREITKAHKVHHGTPICQVCYERLFKRRTCTKCGGPVRALAQDPEPICSKCANHGRVCLRCEKPVLRAGRIVNGKPACPSCAKYFQEMRVCTRCGKVARSLSRIIGVTEDPVCPACRRQLVCATCSVCGKHRERFAVSADGKPLCKKCAANPYASHDCPDCSRPVGGSGNHPCLECSVIRAVRSQAAALLKIFERSEVADLFRQFIEWAISEKKQSRVSSRIGFLAEALLRIERSMKGTAPLDSDAITAALTTEEIRRIGLLGVFLARRGLLTVTAEERRDQSEARRLVTALSELRGNVGEQLREYHMWLGSSERPLSARTLRLYVRAAIEFVRYAEVDQLEGLTLEHLRRFLKAKPGHRASLAAFTKFLKLRLDVFLTLPPKRIKKRETVLNAVPGIKRLLALLEAASTRNGRRALIAELLAAAYGVPLEGVLRLRNADVQIAAGNPQIRFGEDWLDTEPPLDGLIAEIIEDREGATLAPLFPGRLSGDSLSVSAVRYYTSELEPNAATTQPSLTTKTEAELSISHSGGNHEESKF